MLLLLLGCGDDPLRADVPLALVSDQNHQEIQLVRLDRREVVRTVDLAALHADTCGRGEDDAACLPFAAHLSRDAATGEDLLTYQWMVDQKNDGQAGVRYTYAERRRFGAEGGTAVDWRLDALDFLTHFPDRPDICAQAAPCELAPDGGDPDGPDACHMGDAHDLDVLEDGPDGTRLLVADSDNNRTLTVWLPAGTTCGVVEAVVGPDTVPDWRWDTPNDADAVSLAGEEGLLVTFRSTRAADAGGPAEGGEGRGQVVYFAEVDGGYEPRWVYPGEEAFLNSPHDASVWGPEGVDGSLYLLYAHSDGLGGGFQPDWTPRADHHGTVGVARLAGGPPTYLADARLPATDAAGFGFLRSVSPAPEGTFLLADSGCMSPADTCGKVGAVRQIEGLDPTALAPPGGTGAFLPDHAEQTFIEVAEVSRPWRSPLTCDFGTIYTASFLTGDALGGTVIDDAEPTACDGG